MDWVTLIAAVIAMIQKCRENQSDEQIFETIRTAGFQTRFALRQIAREQGLSGRRLHEFVRESITDLNETDDEELKSVMRQAGCSI
jgi:hypothetical protein